jgi:hypothetical protein
MNDFQASAGMEGAGWPLGLFEYRGIEFDGDVAGVEAEGFQERQDGEILGHLTRLAIDYNVHRKNRTQVSESGGSRCVLQ